MNRWCRHRRPRPHRLTRRYRRRTRSRRRRRRPRRRRRRRPKRRRRRRHRRCRSRCRRRRRRPRRHRPDRYRCPRRRLTADAVEGEAAGAALTERIGSAVPAVTEQNSARIASSRRQRAASDAVGAVTDQQRATERFRDVIDEIVVLNSQVAQKRGAVNPRLVRFLARVKKSWSYSEAKSVDCAESAVAGSVLDVSAVSRVDSKLVASAAKVGSTAESEAMIGSRIASSSSAWAAGALAHGVKPNANAAPAVELRPIARRRLTLLLLRLRLLC